MGKGWSLPSRDLPFARPMTPHGPFVLFDVDGTLLDGGVLITDIMIESFLAAGETPPSAADVRAAIGLSVPEMLLTLAPHLDQDRLDKILNGYRLRYFDMVESEEGPPVYPGASKALSVLNKQGLTLGLATGKSRRSLDHVLTAMRWTPVLHTIQCADDNPSKPDPTMVVRAMLETGRRAQDTILIGDSRYDIQMARNAGIASIGVSWGYTSPDVLRAEGAWDIAEDFDHLLQILALMQAEGFQPSN